MNHTMNQRQRQNAILTLVEEAPVASQEELQHRLKRKGFRVGQATLSRDIRKLGLVKSSRGYQAAGEAGAGPLLPSAEHLIQEFVLDVREAQNLLVLKTSPGNANSLAAKARLAAEEQAELRGTGAQHLPGKQRQSQRGRRAEE